MRKENELNFGWSVCASRSNKNLECWFMWRERNRRTRRKPSGQGTQPTYDATRGFEVSALTLPPLWKPVNTGTKRTCKSSVLSGCRYTSGCQNKRHGEFFINTKTRVCNLKVQGVRTTTEKKRKSFKKWPQQASKREHRKSKTEQRILRSRKCQTPEERQVLNFSLLVP